MDGKELPSCRSALTGLEADVAGEPTKVSNEESLSAEGQCVCGC